MGESNEAYQGESGGGDYEGYDGEFYCKGCDEELQGQDRRS